jgi:glutamate--cysteine ligase
MSSDVERASPPIGGIEDLVALIAAGAKKGTLRVGTEHEKLPFFRRTLGPVGYDDGIRPLLLGLAGRGWTPEPEATRPIALKRGQASVTLEPGGQFELSGAPFVSIHETAAELHAHMLELSAVAAPLGIAFAGLGFRPFESTASMPWMPKPRYQVMRDYLPKKGAAALEMMLLSATVQANLDFVSEADMAQKMRCSMSISPVVAAMFACSPYVDGLWRGRRTRRYAMWRQVDVDRCGLLPFVFAEDFGYRHYVEWALDVPMFFLRRGGVYLPLEGVTFRHFIEHGLEGERATIADFENHLSTLFPEVRLKTHLEVRSADAGPMALAIALPAFWKGILYDAESMRAATALLAHLEFPERLAMQIAVAQDGLLAHGAGWHAGELARELVRLAKAGLSRQAVHNAQGEDETIYLVDLERIVESGRTLADDLVERHGAGPFDEPARRRILEESALTA